MSEARPVCAPRFIPGSGMCGMRTCLLFAQPAVVAGEEEAAWSLPGLGQTVFSDRNAFFPPLV